MTRKGISLPKLVAGEPQTEDVTEFLLKLWKTNRKSFRIKTKKESPQEINRRMRMKFLPKIVEMTPYETIGLNKFHIDFDPVKLKPRRRKAYEFKPLPSVEGGWAAGWRLGVSVSSLLIMNVSNVNSCKQLAEQEAEMARAQRIVDKMLRPHIEQYERQQEELERNHHKYYTTLSEIMVSGWPRWAASLLLLAAEFVCQSL